MSFSLDPPVSLPLPALQLADGSCQGTGKSVLLREIIAALKRKNKGRSDAVAVTASTGMAACNIGGTTIHSFSGIGLGIEAAEVLISKVRKNRVSSGKWNRTMILVIDEGALDCCGGVR